MAIAGSVSAAEMALLSFVSSRATLKTAVTERSPRLRRTLKDRIPSRSSSWPSLGMMSRFASPLITAANASRGPGNEISSTSSTLREPGVRLWSRIRSAASSATVNGPVPTGPSVARRNTSTPKRRLSALTALEERSSSISWADCDTTTAPGSSEARCCGERGTPSLNVTCGFRRNRKRECPLGLISFKTSECQVSPRLGTTSGSKTRGLMTVLNPAVSPGDRGANGPIAATRSR